MTINLIIFLTFKNKFSSVCMLRHVTCYINPALYYYYQMGQMENQLNNFQYFFCLIYEVNPKLDNAFFKSKVCVIIMLFLYSVKRLYLKLLPT